MKKAILLILLLPMLASAQYFDVFDIDTSDYPIMKAKFYSIDANGKQILNHTPDDFEITENGEPRDVISVSCPDPLPIPISVGIMVDTKKYINLARHGSERLVNLLDMPQNEVAITYMNQRPLLFQDFTNKKQKGIESSKTIPGAPGGTRVEEMFFDEFAGGISIIKNRKSQNRVLVFISDLHCPNLSINEQQLFKEARDNNIRIYSLLIGTTDYTGLFERIASETNGKVFENVRDSIEIENIFEKIAFREQNEPCEISWNSNVNCNDRIDLKIFNKTSSLSVNYNYRIAKNQIVSLELNPYFINFGKLSEGEAKDTSITITAKNFIQVISSISIEPDNGFFEVINSLPIVIQKDKSIELMIRYNAIDTSKQYSKLTFNTDYCEFNIGLLAGSKFGPISNRTLELTHPNGGEVFIAGSDTIIKWKGISENERVNLNFTSNNGNTWEVISNESTYGIHKWELPKFKSDSCLILVIQNENNYSQSIGEIEWEKSYGGIITEEANSIILTNDGGYIIAGYSNSTDGDITDSKGNHDYWLLKLKVDGNLEWQKSYGGSNDERANSIIQTSDGGYIVAGFSNSKDGDISGAKPNEDYWILKLDINGEIEWEKSYGGGRDEQAKSIIQTSDGGYIVAGSSASTDGDITDPRGYYDYWIVKLRPNGDLEWEKSYGGSNDERANSIIQTSDGGYIVAGFSNSKDGDITDPRGYYDYWIVKLRSNGDLEWEKSYGGSNNEEAKSIIQTYDNGFIVAGYSLSSDGDITDPRGYYDYWIVKLRSNGDLEWEKSYGGSGIDIANSVVQSSDGGYIAAGFIESTDGDITNHKGGVYDYWIVKLRSNGDLEWEKSYGGSSDEQAKSIIQTIDGGYIVAGYSRSTNGDITDHRGNLDYWIFKIAVPLPPLQSDTSDAVFSIIMPEPVIQNNDIDMGQMIVGSTKDTIVSSVICNVGDAPLHVLGVDITDAFDSDDFLIPRGAGDFYLDKDQCQDMMFEFTPSQLGNRTAVATIRTTIGDFTDTINIRGVGINPLIEATADVVDFGQFELGDGKDTNVVLIKNVGADDITITETKITGPDMEQFDMVPLPTFTLTSGDDKELELNYTAKYGGRTSSIIEFHYDGVGSPLRSMLFAEGIGGEVYPQVPDAYVGERVELGLHLGRMKPEGLDEVATNFTATISYNSTLLAPIDKNMTVTTENTTSFIKIEGQLSGVSQIATVPMKVGLGTAVKSGLVVTEFQLYDANGDSVEYEIEPGVGEFNVLGICEEGGTRLVNPNSEKVGLRVAQNRLNTSATIYLDIIESGQTNLIIYDQLGNAIETAYSGIPSTGSKELSLDLSNYSNGRYYIKLTTPTITKTEIIEVVR